MKKRVITRRTFLAGTAATLAGCASWKKAPAVISKSPNEKLNLAAIGCGGKGRGDIENAFKVGENNVVALCDVDFNRGADAFNRWPDAKQYKDFRKMLEQEKSIDAVTVSTPDHVHAPAAMLAMSLGKHVYVQKPLTHNVLEARTLAKAAKKYGVMTQMGNQGHSDPGVRELCEMVWDDVIGDVKEVHCWTNRPVWPQGIGKPAGSDPVREGLDWDLWLGPAPFRDYKDKHPDTGKDCYCPFVWRGWWDFGCGALGDMACHIMDPANWALSFGVPDSIECIEQEGLNDQTGPNKSIIKYTFPKRKSTATGGAWKGKMLPALTFFWHDGGLMPPRPDYIPADYVLGDGGSNGTLMVGDKGALTCGCYGGEPRLLPEKTFADYKRPDEYIRRVGNSYIDWITACKGGPVPCSNFDYSGPFTEMVCLGNVALRAGSKIEYDIRNMKITNNKDANQYLQRVYRDGWTLDV
jgi:predicted dehydrogenase